MGFINIIIEGPDRTGKDTQIDLIRKNFTCRPFQLLHYRTPPKSFIEFNYQQKIFHGMFELISLNKCNFILNRSHLGEHVYASLYRFYDPSYIWYFESVYEKLYHYNDRTLLVLLVDSPENLLFREDGNSHSTQIDNKRKELKLFEEAYIMSTIKNKIMINIENKSPDVVYNLIETAIERLTNDNC